MSSLTEGADSIRAARVYCSACGRRNHVTYSFCTACSASLSDSGRDRRVLGDSGGPGGHWGWLHASADVLDGQKLLVGTRWVLVVAGLILALWNPDNLSDLKVEIGFILTLAVANFFLHVQLQGKRAPWPWVAYLASVVDIVAITTIVAVNGGAASGLYVFYFPALFAISVAFRLPASLFVSGAAILVYTWILAPDLGGGQGALMATRLLMMAAVAVCGAVYRRIEVERRIEAGELS